MNLLSFNFDKDFCPQHKLSSVFEGGFENIKELKLEIAIDKGRVNYREDIMACVCK